jgi:6-phosphogluconolactonase
MATSVKNAVRIFPDPDILAENAARLFAAAADQAIAEQGRFSVALSGGATPRALFRILSAAYRDRVRWKQVHLFWSDERSVPPDHEQSNFRLAHEELISKIALPWENIHRIEGELPPAEAAALYETELYRHFGSSGLPRFDLILLGVGRDGHTASLFPDSAILQESARLVVPSYSEEAGNWRVTLTLPVLNHAAAVLFLVSGTAKAHVISGILGKWRRHPYPAALVAPAQGHVIWLIDREAASELKE